MLSIFPVKVNPTIHQYVEFLPNVYKDFGNLKQYNKYKAYKACANSENKMKKVLSFYYKLYSRIFLSSVQFN